MVFSSLIFLWLFLPIIFCSYDAGVKRVFMKNELYNFN